MSAEAALLSLLADLQTDKMQLTQRAAAAEAEAAYLREQLDQAQRPTEPPKP